MYIAACDAARHRGCSEETDERERQTGQLRLAEALDVPHQLTGGRVPHAR